MSDQAIFIFGCFVAVLVVIASYLVIGVPRGRQQSNGAEVDVASVRRDNQQLR